MTTKMDQDSRQDASHAMLSQASLDKAELFFTVELEPVTTRPTKQSSLSPGAHLPILPLLMPLTPLPQQWPANYNGSQSGPSMTQQAIFKAEASSHKESNRDSVVDIPEPMAGPFRYVPYNPYNHHRASSTNFDALTGGTILPEPILTEPHGEAEYYLVDFDPQATSSPDDLSDESPRKFSFDENAPPDWEVLMLACDQGSSAEHRTQKQCSENSDIIIGKEAEAKMREGWMLIPTGAVTPYMPTFDIWKLRELTKDVTDSTPARNRKKCALKRLSGLFRG